MSDAPVLVCTDGPLAGQHFEVTEAGLTIGRGDTNTIVIPDDDVSRSHAALQYDNGSLWLRDLGSRNGVFVNDARLGNHKDLRVGDVVRVGGSSFEVRWASDSQDGGGDGDASDSSKRRSWFSIFDR